MDKTRLYLRCSSSISNFEDKLKRRTGLKEYHPIKNAFDKVVFFGMYHPLDYLRLIFHRGQKNVFWCGGDILNLKNGKYFSTGIWRRILPLVKAKHFCENAIEQECLLRMGIKSEIQPMIFDVPIVKVAYKSVRKLHVYMCCPDGREEEYGVELIEAIAFAFKNIVFHIYGPNKKYGRDNIRYHGQVSPEQFAKEIKEYHCGLRLNDFEGFSEVTARSALLGQHPISRMYNPHVTYAPTLTELIKSLKELKKKKKPNLIAQKYWADRLEQSLCAVLS